MLAYNPDIPLISLHVPKCAGTSFERVLKQWFGQRLFLHYYNPRKNQMPKKHNIKHRFFPWRYKRNICIHGHFHSRYGNGAEDYYPQISQYMTILRDPFERAISNYFYEKKRGERRVVYGKRITIEEEYGDLETYLLEAPLMISEFLSPNITMENYVDVFEKTFVYIGIVEDFQTSVNILADKLGKPRLTIPHLNISPRTMILSDEARIQAEFRERNKLSYSLYNYAKEHYMK